MRLIDADEYAYWVIDHMTTPWDRAKKHISNDYDKGLYDATLLLNTMPTIEERNKGKWINDRLVSTNGGTYGVRRCSECEAYYQDVGYGWNYCPNCGSYNGGEGNETD